MTIITATVLLVSELLIGIFLYNNFHTAGPAAAISTPSESLPVIKKSPESFIYLPSTDLEKPSPLPSPSVVPKVYAERKTTDAVKGVQSSGFSKSQVLEALNTYRSKNGVGSLELDNKLQDYAQGRADYLRSLGRLDKHFGHKEFMKNNGFERLGFGAVAENQSWNYKGGAQGLIESFYAKSPGHNKNQLSSEYSHVGIGISGAFTNLVFGGKKR